MPPGRKRYLERMAQLACEGEPAIVCLQELPVAALSRLRAWSGYDVRGEVAMRPRLPAELGYRVTNLSPGLLRSAFEGQANAILVEPGSTILEHRSIVLNPRRFATRVAGARERRVCHAVRVRLPDGRRAVVANLHATSYARDRSLADAEVARAVAFADGLAGDDPLVLAGDVNITVEASPALRGLSGGGFSDPGPGIDHILVRGLDVVEPLSAWPQHRRLHDGRLLSDHAPVELRVA